MDALIGRLVLMYFPDPAAVRRHLLSLVKPGGIVAFQELDMHSAVVEPMANEFWTAGQRLSQTFTRAGIETHMGLKLPAVFRAAG
ncbi:hypothetical protein [Deinococcus sp.]|uniref:hypothetical protein n=1 Tax=Deinococcus sp. TaxID=47478 RepID=UPI0028699897|nr:hypothetical protein [Deinococcus sp.]